MKNLADFGQDPDRNGAAQAESVRLSSYIRTMISGLRNARRAYRRSLEARHVESRRLVRNLKRELAEERQRVARLREVLNPPLG